jgi:hypothetical protein
MSDTAKSILAGAMVLAGMAGLYFKIEYSGWVLFVGLVAAWSVY